MQTDLVERARGGDEAAFASLAVGIIERLRIVARGILSDPDQAEDAAQEALLQIWNHLPRLRDPGSFNAWSYRLVVNASHAEWRRSGARIGAFASRIEDGPIAFDEHGRVDDRDAIELAFSALSTEQRSVVARHHFMGVPLDAIAREMGVAPGTIHARHHRAMRILRAAVEAGTRTAAGFGGGPALADATLRRTAARPWEADRLFRGHHGRTIRVVRDGTGDATTITDGVGLAADGDLVLVGPGIYRESIHVANHITIAGDGSRDDVVLDFTGRGERTLAYGSGSSAALCYLPYGFLVRHCKARISNLTIRGPRLGVAIVVEGGAPVLTHLQVALTGEWIGPTNMFSERPGSFHHFLFMHRRSAGLVADNTASAHIHITDGSSPTVERNDLGGALFVGGPGSRPWVRDNIINIRTRTRFCLGVSWGAAPIVEGNEFTHAGGPAVAVSQLGTAAIIRDNLIHGSRSGVLVWAGGIPAIERNEISGNAIGIHLRSSAPYLAGNVIHGNRSGSLTLAQGAAPKIEGNRITANGRGDSAPARSWQHPP